MSIRANEACTECGWFAIHDESGFCLKCGSRQGTALTVETSTAPHSILQQAQEAVADRQDRYGDCTEVFSITAEMFNAYRRGRKGATGAQDTAVFNICQKLARISCGQGHRDNWVDIAGYADRGAEVSDG